MNTRLAICTTFALFLLNLAASDTKTYYQSQTPRSLSDWRESKDQKVSVCFTVDKTTFRTNETIRVRCAVRNSTDKSLTILRPFGDDFYAHSAGLTILGPDGAIPYSGPMKEYELGLESFVELQAHTVVDETLELPVRIFPGLGKPGLYIIGYRFHSAGYPSNPRPTNFWGGEIKAPSVNILIKQ